VELSKALNIVGDYRLSSGVHTDRWAVVPVSGSLPEYDYSCSYSAPASTGYVTQTQIETYSQSYAGTVGSACFCAAVNLETSNGVEISGLNAEEQSDIAFLASWSSPQVTGTSASPSNIEVYSYYDAMIVLRENNVLELIQ
jgi:hypothetical protein